MDDHDNTSFPLSDFGLGDMEYSLYPSSTDHTTMPPPEQHAYTDHHTLEPHTDPSTEAEGHTNSSSGTGSSTTIGVKQRGRRRTSAVWESFDEEISVVDGVRRVVARCKRCKKEYTGEAKGGTGHLKRHVESHAKADGKSASGSAAVQTQLSFNPDGTVRNFTYDANVQREGLCRLIASNDLPLGFGESDGFVEYIQTYHNPNYRPVSRQTTSRDMKKLCKTSLQKIKDDFTTCTFSVSLTSDIWSGRAKQDYISVVTHYVNEHWHLQKRVTGFELIDVAHSGLNIAQVVLKVVNDFNLADKVFSITLDNASANTSAMNTLTPIFSIYVASFLMHQRCACHIINLIAKCAIKRCKKEVEIIGIAISFLGNSNQRISSYLKYCIAIGKTPHKYNLDMPVRWNSTYLMLKAVIRDRVQLNGFINANYGVEPLISEETWHVITALTAFLDLFYDATVTLSGVYYPTSPLMVHTLLDIASHLKAYEGDRLLLNVVADMKTKYLKYWQQIPLLYAFAFILDPRAKLEGYRSALNVLSASLSLDYTDDFNKAREKLFEVFAKYEEKYAGVRMQRPPPTPTAGKKRGAWSKIFGSSSSSTAGSSSTSTSVLQGGGELAKYLNSDKVNFNEEEEEDFDIIQWWHEHKLTYPVLSILAWDVLSVPVSSTSSESAFSLAGRILEERRTSLTPDMVRTLMAVKDGELAKRKAQHTAENRELMATFENLEDDEDE